MLLNMLINKPEKSILILEKNKDNYKQILLCLPPVLIPTVLVAAKSLSGRMKRTYASYFILHLGGRACGTRIFVKTVQGESTQALNSFLVSLKF